MRLLLRLQVLLPVLVLLHYQPSPVAAQVPVEFGGYLGAAVPRGEWKEDGADTGWGYGVTITARPLPLVGIYGGWDRFRFGMDEGEAGANTDVTFIDSGIRAGVELKLPLPVVAPFLSGGGFYGDSEVEIREEGTTSRFRTGSDFGYEASAGFDVDVGPVRIRPGVVYRNRDAEFGSFLGEIERRRVRISYLAYTLGVTLVP